MVILMTVCFRTEKHYVWHKTYPALLKLTLNQKKIENIFVRIFLSGYGMKNEEII